MSVAVKVAESLYSVQRAFDTEVKPKLSLLMLQGVGDLPEGIAKFDGLVSTVFDLGRDVSSVVNLNTTWGEIRDLILLKDRSQGSIGVRCKKLWSDVFPGSEMQPKFLDAILSRRIQVAFETAMQAAKAELSLKYLHPTKTEAFSARMKAAIADAKRLAKPEVLYEEGDAAKIATCCSFFITQGAEEVAILSLRRIKGLGEFFLAYRYLQKAFPRSVALVMTYPFQDQRPGLLEKAFFLYAEEQNFDKCVDIYFQLAKSSLAEKFKIQEEIGDEFSAEEKALLIWFFKKCSKDKSAGAVNVEMSTKGLAEAIVKMMQLRVA